MTRMDAGRITIRVKSCLQRSIKEKGELDYGYMEGLDFQPDYELWQLMKTTPKLKKDGKDVVLQIPIPAGGAVQALNTFITGYKFTLIMVVGNPIEERVLQT